MSSNLIVDGTSFYSRFHPRRSFVGHFYQQTIRRTSRIAMLGRVPPVLLSGQTVPPASIEKGIIYVLVLFFRALLSINILVCVIIERIYSTPMQGLHPLSERQMTRPLHKPERRSSKSTKELSQCIRMLIRMLLPSSSLLVLQIYDNYTSKYIDMLACCLSDREVRFRPCFETQTP